MSIEAGVAYSGEMPIIGLPLDRARLPELLLRRLIGMSIEAGIAYSREVPIIGFPLD